MKHPIRTRAALALIASSTLLGMLGKAEAAPTTPTLAVSVPKLTPYSSGGCTPPPATSTASSTWANPCFHVYGHTDPSVLVTITATDGVHPTPSETVSLYSAERDDPWAGITAGDFSTSMSVTDIGTHEATPSTVVFTAIAKDASGAMSAAGTASVLKEAVTAGDTVGPVLNVRAFGPPSFWCNTGNCFDPTRYRTCIDAGDLAAPLNAVPGLGPAIVSFAHALVPGPGCAGAAKITGEAYDDSPNAQGIASEVASVVVTVKQGGTVVKLYPNVIGARRGTTGFWSVSLKWSDYQIGSSYVWSAQAFDAAGNGGPVQLGSFEILVG